MLSDADLASIRADIASSLPDRCTVLRDTLVADGSGGQAASTAVIGTVDCRISPQTERIRSSSEIVGGQVTSLIGWLIATPQGTDVREQDRVRSVRVQSLTVVGATSGTFTLTHGAQTTAAVARNATAAAVQAALVALTSIGAGNVACTGGPLGTAAVSISFPAIAGVLLSANGAGLSAGATATIGSRVFQVGAVFGPRSYEIDRRVLAREIF